MAVIVAVKGIAAAAVPALNVGARAGLNGIVAGTSPRHTCHLLIAEVRARDLMGGGGTGSQEFTSTVSAGTKETVDRPTQRHTTRNTTAAKSIL